MSFALVLAACASEGELYRWGSYEDCVRETCLDSSPAHRVDRIHHLAAEIAWAKAEGRRVGPGVHAQLGYLDYLVGDAAAGALELAAERELYPESAVFIDGLIRRMKARGSP